jgi:hypothetical protein
MAGTSGRGEAPPSVPGASGAIGDPPDFPPGVDPGDPPGLGGKKKDDDDKVNAPTPSTIGGNLALVGYGIAGVATVYLAVRTGKAFFANRRMRRMSEEIKKALGRWEEESPGGLAKIEEAYGKYRIVFKELNDHIGKLGEAVRVAPEDLDRHVERLLTEIPALARNGRLYEEAKKLVADWQRDRSLAQVLDRWLDENRDQFFLRRTTKGRAWLNEYRRLRDPASVFREGQKAAEAWRAKGSVAEILRWLARHEGSSVIKSWADTFRHLRAQEAGYAEALTLGLNQMVDDCRKYFSDPSVKEASEAKDPLPSPLAFEIQRPREVREPGRFFINDEPIAHSDLVAKAKGHCGELYAYLQDLVPPPVGLATTVLRIAWPVGTLVTGYVTIQGIGHAIHPEP